MVKNGADHPLNVALEANKGMMEPEAQILFDLKQWRGAVLSIKDSKNNWSITEQEFAILLKVVAERDLLQARIAEALDGIDYVDEASWQNAIIHIANVLRGRKDNELEGI